MSAQPAQSKGIVSRIVEPLAKVQIVGTDRQQQQQSVLGSWISILDYGRSILLLLGGFRKPRHRPTREMDIIAHSMCTAVSTEVAHFFSIHYTRGSLISVHFTS